MRLFDGEYKGSVKTEQYGLSLYIPSSQFSIQTSLRNKHSFVLLLSYLIIQILYIYPMSPSLKSLAGLAAMLAALQVGASTIPKGPGLTARDSAKLSRRMEINYLDCSDDQKTKLGIDFADATALAGIAFSLDDQSATAFTHYLRPEDADSAKSLWSMVAANNDPTNAPYTFSVRCGKPDDADCKAPRKGGERFVTP